MSNVTGEAVEDVSSYMTAIWNNFADESHSLEHYADVITSLGAATASSSEEIAGGLEKFAAIGNQIGLSYEYATTALATVVARTRQSEDVVGTAFKTIFSRIQGLKLGETLEDGTDLNKYSKALAAVGVNIKDASGELKNMDTILDEMGEKWVTLSRDEQTALAQTVAGVRQYNQLVALMDSWQTSFQDNLAVARDSEGSLQKQADIYAESWEAARKRVKASIQDIYKQLIDDKTFIGITNGAASVVDSISNIVDAMGGLEGVLGLLGTVMLKVFGNDISTAMDNFVYNIKIGTKAGKEAILKEREAFNQQLITLSDTGSVLGAAQADIYRAQGTIQNDLIAKATELQAKNKEISDSEQMQLNLLMDINNQLGEEYQKSSQNLTQLEAQTAEIKSRALLGDSHLLIKDENGKSMFQSKDKYKEELNKLIELQEAFSMAEQLKNKFFSHSEMNESGSIQQELAKILDQIDDFVPITDEASEKVQDLRNALEKLANGEGSVDDLDNILNEIGNAASEGFDKLINGLDASDPKAKRLKENLQSLQESIMAQGNTIANTAIKSNNYVQSVENLRKKISELEGATATVSQRIIALGGALSSFSMMVNSIKGIADTISNPDLSGWEKFVSIAGSLGMVLPMMVSSLKNVSTVFGAQSSIIDVLNAKYTALQATKIATKATAQAEIALNAINNAGQKEQIKTIFALIAANKLNLKELSKEEMQQVVNIALGNKAKNLTEEQITAIYAKIVAQEANTKATEKATAAQNAFNTSLLKNPITWIVIILGTAIAAYTAYTKKVEKAKEETIENAKASAEAYKETQTEIDNLNSKLETLTSRIEELQELADSGKISITEEEELERLEKENAKLEAQIKLKEELAKKQMSRAAADARTAAQNDVYDTSSADKMIVASNSQNSSNYRAEKRLREAAGGIDITNISATDMEGYEEWYSAVDNEVKSLKASENKKEQEQGSKLEKELEDYSEKWLALNKTAMADLETAYNAATENLPALYEQTKEEDYSGQYDDAIAYYEGKTLEYYKAFGTLDGLLSNALSGSLTSNEQLKNLKDKKDDILSEDDTKEVLKGIVGEDAANSLGLWAESLNISLKDLVANIDDINLDLSKKTEEEVNPLESIGSTKPSAFNLIAGIQSGDVTKENIGENEDYKNLLNSLELIKQEYPELTSAAELLNKTWLVGTQEYSEALEKVQDKIYEIDLSNLADKAKETSDAFKTLLKDNKLNIDDEEFKSKLDNLLNAQYEIDVAVHMEAEQEFDSAVNAISDIKEKAALIGENFVVAAEDVRELNNTFPGILDGVKNLSDGTLQLNKEAVESAMSMAEAEAKADAEATLEKLHNQAILLRSKQKIYENMANAARILAESETGTDELAAQARADISSGLAKLQTLNSQESTKITNDNAKATADSSYENGQKVSGNWESAFQNMADASYQAAKIAIDNMNAVANKGTAKEGTIKVQYNGSSGVDKEASIVEMTQRTLETNGNEDTEKWAQISESFAQLSDASGAAANDIEGMMLQLGTVGTNLSKNLGSISKGKGAVDSKGSGSDKNAKTKDLVDKFDPDPFHKINQELEDIEHNLKMLNKEQSHMFGGELIGNLKQQNKLLNQQMELHQQKAEIARSEAAALRSQLEAEGVAFDGDNVANYNAMLQAAEAQINSLIMQYNALSVAEQEAWDKMYQGTTDPIKQAQEYYDTLKKNMDKYVEYMSTVYSEEEAAQDALYQQIENNLEAYKVEIELKLDTTDAERTLNKFLKNMRTDIKNLYKTTAEWADVFDTAVLDANTYKTDTKTKLEQLSTYKNASYGGTGDIFATESEKLKAITDLEKEIIEDSENMLSLYQEAYDNLRDSFGEVADQFNDILDGFDDINDTLDHYAKIAELLHGAETELGMGELSTAYGIQRENSLARQEALRDYRQALEARRAAALAKGYDEDDSYIKDIEEEIKETSKNLESEIENYIDVIQRQLENAINMAKYTMDQNIWGTQLTDVRQEWDDKKAQAEGYYDTVERIYQLESLEAKWKASILSTSSMKAQQQLTELMEKQVASLTSKTALSEKDIELAEKELQVYQAQIALEDAQNNKNSMKLTRDESGNWSYQYVADEGDIASKQEDYLAKINEWRTASINASEEISEKIMESYQQFSERMTEIMNNVTLSEEEREMKIAELNETYWGADGIITKAVEDSNYIQGVANRATYEELASLYLVDEENLALMSEHEKEIIKDLTDNGILSYGTLRDYVIGDDGKTGLYADLRDRCIEVNKDSSAAWQSMASDVIGLMYKDPDSVRANIDSAYKEMTNSLNFYNSAIVESEKTSGIEWSKVEKQLESVRSSIDKTANKVDDITNKIYTLDTFEDKVLEIRNAWDEVAASIRGATNDLMTYLSMLANVKSAAASGAGSSGGGGASPSTNSNVNKNNSNDSESNKNTEKKKQEGEKYRYVTVTTKSGKGAGTYPIEMLPSNMKDDKKYNYKYFDTGGYTGDWNGGDGRLAILHSKELVLNKKDTENILEAVSTVRSISSLGTSIASSIASGIGKMISAFSGLKPANYTSTTNNSSSDNSSNTFEITMNVDGGNVEEIQKAILDLPNLASQFLSKR